MLDEYTEKRVRPTDFTKSKTEDDYQESLGGVTEAN